MQILKFSNVYQVLGFYKGSEELEIGGGVGFDGVEIELLTFGVEFFEGTAED